MKKVSIALIFTGIIGAIYFGLLNKNSPPTLSEKMSTPLVERTDDSVEVEEVFEAEEFESQLKLLPNLEDLSKLTYEEAHHAPEIIKDAGERIGRVHQQAQDEPRKRVAAMGFFKSCVEDDFLAPAIRAVCLHKIYQLIPVWKIPVPLTESNIPQEIIDLSMKLH